MSDREYYYANDDCYAELLAQCETLGVGERIIVRFPDESDQLAADRLAYRVEQDNIPGLTARPENAQFTAPFKPMKAGKVIIERVHEPSAK